MLMFKKLIKIPSVDLHSSEPLKKDIFKDYHKTEKYRLKYIKNNLVKNYSEISSIYFIKIINKLIKTINIPY